MGSCNRRSEIRRPQISVEIVLIIILLVCFVNHMGAEMQTFMGIAFAPLISRGLNGAFMGGEKRHSGGIVQSRARIRY